MIERRIRIRAPRKIPEPLAAPVLPTDVIIERDDGLFQIGLADDAPGGFPTRSFAVAFAARREVAA